VCYEHSVLLLGDGLFVCEVLDLDLVGGIQKKNGWMDGRSQDSVLVECNAKDLDKSNLQMEDTVVFFLSSDYSKLEASFVT
jgi:hypothetical protein